MAEADHDSWRIPSTVQELAATMEEPPSRYLIPEQERLDGGQQLVGEEMPEPVPAIDLCRLLASHDDAEEESGKLRSALLNWGFFLVSRFLLPSSSSS